MNQDEILGRVVRQYETDLRSALAVRDRVQQRASAIHGAVNDAANRLSVGICDDPESTLDAIVTHCEVRERLPDPEKEGLRELAQRWRDLCDAVGVDEGIGVEPMLTAARSQTLSLAELVRAGGHNSVRDALYAALAGPEYDLQRARLMQISDLVGMRSPDESVLHSAWLTALCAWIEQHCACASYPSAS